MEATDHEGSLLLLLLLLQKRFRSCGGNHCAAVRRGRSRDLRPPGAPYVRKSRFPGRGTDPAIAGTRQAVQTQTPRDFLEKRTRPPGRPARGGPSARPCAGASRRVSRFLGEDGGHGASVLTESRQCLSFQARTVCTQSQESACGSDPVQVSVAMPSRDAKEGRKA